MKNKYSSKTAFRLLRREISESPEPIYGNLQENEVQWIANDIQVFQTAFDKSLKNWEDMHLIFLTQCWKINLGMNLCPFMSSIAGKV